MDQLKDLPVHRGGDEGLLVDHADIAEGGLPVAVQGDVLPLEAHVVSVANVRLWILLLEGCQLLIIDAPAHSINSNLC